MKAYVEVKHSCRRLISAARLGRFTPGKLGPSTSWVEGWVSPTAGLDFWRRIKKYPASAGIRTQNPQACGVVFLECARYLAVK